MHIFRTKIIKAVHPTNPNRKLWILPLHLLKLYSKQKQAMPPECRQVIHTVALLWNTATDGPQGSIQPQRWKLTPSMEQEPNFLPRDLGSTATQNGPARVLENTWASLKVSAPPAGRNSVWPEQPSPGAKCESQRAGSASPGAQEQSWLCPLPGGLQWWQEHINLTAHSLKAW